MIILTSEKKITFQIRSLSLNSVLLVISGSLMLCASVLPWLNDPWGMTYSAWYLPIDIGWQFHTNKFNYGILCCLCALYIFFVTYAYKKSSGKIRRIILPRTFIGFMCICPVILLFLQYLFIDFDSINLLAQHKIQMLLIQHHYGYGIAPPVVPLQPFTIDISSLGGRIQLIINQVSFGIFLPFLSMGLLMYREKSAFSASAFSLRKQKSISLVIVFVVLFALGMLLRAPLGILYEQQARVSLANGDYPGALGLLDKARLFNPSLDHVAFYHIERGQAEYFLHINQLDDDSHAYLASVYRGQNGTLDAYQQLFIVWRLHSSPSPWVVDELSVTLEQMVEIDGPLRRNSPVLDVPASLLQSDTIALQWLRPLLQIDPHNLYALYIEGVIQYDLHSYTLSDVQLKTALYLSSDLDFQSSVYTFMALDDIKQGDYTNGRALLLLAEKFDPAYHNNAAREEMSGLR